MKEVQDISNLVISMSGVMAKLNDILADCFILDMNMSIAGVGREMENLLGFSSEEIGGESFPDLCMEANVRELMEQKLRAGYFIDFAATLWTRNGEPCKAALSGFYLGFISDINGYIILKVKPKENSAELKKELFIRKRELDTFIYRTAHDLRGPLATIKGLVNLLKIRESDLEVDTLTELIEAHAEKLDDRLFKLLYLANDNDSREQGSGCIDFLRLKDKLVRTLEDNSHLDSETIRYQAPAEDLCKVSDKAIERLLKHVLLYLIGLPTAGGKGEVEILIDCGVSDQQLQVTFNARGFQINDDVRQVMRRPLSLYSELLSHPLLFDYYVAYKEASLLAADLRIDFLNSSHQIIGISVPLGVTKERKSIGNPLNLSK